MSEKCRLAHDEMSLCTHCRGESLPGEQRPRAGDSGGRTPCVAGGNAAEGRPWKALQGPTQGNVHSPLDPAIRIPRYFRKRKKSYRHTDLHTNVPKSLTDQSSKLEATQIPTYTQPEAQPQDGLPLTEEEERAAGAPAERNPWDTVPRGSSRT